MKEILDIVVLILFAFMIFMFIKGFNKQQINKYTNKLEENEKRSSENKKEKVDE